MSGPFKIKDNPFENDWRIGASEEKILISWKNRPFKTAGAWRIGAFRIKNNPF